MFQFKLPPNMQVVGNQPQFPLIQNAKSQTVCSQLPSKHFYVGSNSNKVGAGNLQKLTRAQNFSNTLRAVNKVKSSSSTIIDLPSHSRSSSPDDALRLKHLLCFKLSPVDASHKPALATDPKQAEAKQLRTTELGEQETPSLNVADKGSYFTGERKLVENKPSNRKSSVSDLRKKIISNPSKSQVSEKIEISQTDNCKEELSSISSDERVGEFYPCSLCSAQLRSKIGVERHLQRFHNVQSTHTCNVCNKEFKYMCLLETHIKTHKSEDDHTCDTCGYTNFNKTALKWHKMRHLRQYRFKCELCDRGFYFRSQLKYHQKQHSNLNQYHCELCSQSWKSSSTLAAHLRICHSELYRDQPLFECDACGRKFVLKQMLTRHNKRYHRQDKCPNLCEICGKSFTSSASLKAHLRSHKGEMSVVCDVCGKSFVSTRYLTIHSRVHTGEKPYTCDHCGKSFTQISSIKIHMRYHTGERPYKCSICERCFVSRSVMNHHLKSFHSVN